VNGKSDSEFKAGGANMFSINRICLAGAVASAIGAVLMASGCGVAGMQRAAEVRVATTLEAGSPKLIVSGPARLLHVDVHGRQALNIYSVKRAADGTANCADQARSDVFQLRQGASNELNIEVMGDEAICLGNDPGDGTAHDADVSWHARRGVGTPVETGHALHASNL
jgi:hypothetical protein